MSLLQEIQKDAIDSSVSVATLLRKCMVLASRLGNPEFQDWVRSELGGYSKEQPLPPYRCYRVTSKGNLIGLDGLQLRDAPLSLHNLIEDLQELLRSIDFRDPVAKLEEIIRSAKAAGKDVVQVPWVPEVVAMIPGNFYENFRCLEAWKVLAVSQLVATSDSVRNKVLEFVLRIERESPQAGEVTAAASPISQEKVQQIFHMTINGNVQNLATASTNVRQEATCRDRDPELFRDLLKSIAHSGAPASEIAEASDRVKGMADASTGGAFLKPYQEFTSFLADHIQIGLAAMPYLPALAALLI